MRKKFTVYRIKFGFQPSYNGLKREKKKSKVRKERKKNSEIKGMKKH